VYCRLILDSSAQRGKVDPAGIRKAGRRVFSLTIR
jgi:hypothetical protein